jgi:asparagine synthase (glutamine-hydrolysing)
MCGIVAIFSKEKPIDAERLKKATERLNHRGPDEQHQWLSPGERLGLGHARLSLVDLETGAQPIAGEDQRYHIAVNGEFYDFVRIRLELESRGHRFRTRSDSEIALHLFEEDGAECLQQLRGEFAFVIWDEIEQKLFAARDRFGIKPLFYAQVDGTLYIASEAKALFAAGVAARWDEPSAFQSIFLCMGQGSSLFKGVEQLPPGHFLTASRDSLKISRYWDVDYPQSDTAPSGVGEQEYITELRKLLDESVSLRMQADVPVACYLSGGVDSSSVLAMASRHSNRRVTAFTVAFDHPEFDEGPAAGEMAESVGAEFLPIAVREADSAQVFAEAVGHGEMIHYNAHGAARFLLSRFVRQKGFKAVLAGEGADEVFAGYDFCRTAVVTKKQSRVDALLFLLRAVMQPWNESQRAIGGISPWLARATKAPGFPVFLLDSLAGKFRVLQRLLRREFLDSTRALDPVKKLADGLDLRRNVRGREPARQILYLWLKSLFANYVLAGERLDMAHSVEVRLPFLDHKLFEYARNIPVARLAPGGKRKQLLREAVKPIVTDRVYCGSKQPFFAPPSTLRAGNALYCVLQDTLRSAAFSRSPFFEQRAAMALLDELPRMDSEKRAEMDPILFMMASLSILGEYYRL